ncbi:MAG TPA: ATP-binding protein [Polyangia bacterium]|nr:ATP-binding protein [Polyangia bacterium]
MEQCQPTLALASVLLAWNDVRAASPARWPIALGASIVLVQTALIAVLLVERAWRLRAQGALDERLRFERLVAEVSANFAQLPVERIDAQIMASLRRIGEALGADRGGLWHLEPDASALALVQGWHVPGVRPPFPVLMAELFPGGLDWMRGGEALRMDAAEGVGIADRTHRLIQEMTRAKIASVVAVSVPAFGVAGGILAFSSDQRLRPWPDEVLHGLRTLGEVFARAVHRREAETALAHSEALTRAALSSLPGAVAVLDRTGTVLRVNRGWAAAAPPFSLIPEGTNYLAALGRSVAAGDGTLDKIRVLVEQVLAGQHGAGLVEHHLAAAGRWVEVHAEPLDWPEGGGVVSHVEVTERKRAEIEAQRTREEIAHVGRVVALGELAVSIAHEINQPLAAILLNAQTALRLLGEPTPGLAEVRAAVADVIADDRRAAEVIGRLRTFLKKSEVRHARHDANALATEVVRLVASDALLREVTLALVPAAGPLYVWGSGVQLQQVLLNLITNAFEAVARQAPDTERRVWVRTMRVGERVVLAVEDTGHGIPTEALEKIFEPFYAMREGALGIGLSISRRIVEAHGGHLWAERRPGGGAILSCELPRAEEDAV